MMKKPVDDHFLREGQSPLSYSDRVEGFLALWKELAMEAGGGINPIVPSKPLFSMRRLKPFLPYYFVAEWTGDDLVNRLVGSALDQAFGAGLTGKSFLESYEGEQHCFFQTFWRQLLDRPCGVVTRRTLYLADQRKLRLSGISLPVCDEQGAVRYLAGVAEFARAYNSSEETSRQRYVYIDHVQYVDLGFGVPADAPDPASFNSVTRAGMQAAC